MLPIYCLSLREQPDLPDPFKGAVVVKGHTGVDKKRSFSESYCKMLQAFVDSGQPMALLLEDDAIPTVPNVLIKIYNRVFNAPVKWEAIYLGGNVYPSGAERYHYGGGYYRAFDVLTSHAIVWKRSLAIYCLENYDYNKHGVFDLWLYNEVQRLKVMLIIKPFLVLQKPGMSEIEGKDVDYTDIFRNSETRLK